MKRYLSLMGIALFVIPFSSCQSSLTSLDSGTSSVSIDDLEGVTNTTSSVFYEIFVGSFYDSDGDGMGDFGGATAKIDYLADLGVGGVWFMPIHPSPTYHKYDVTDYYAVAPQYGTMDDFETFVTTAANHHIDTIIDLVINHTSNYHPWFTEAVELYGNDDCADPASVCHYYNFTREVKAGYSMINGFFYEARFWSGMPDLNLDNPYLRAEIENIVSFWLAKGVKGFRLDAVTSYYTDRDSQNIAFLAWLNTMVKALDPAAYIVAEGPWATIMGQLVPYYSSHIDSFFNFPLSVTGNRLYTHIRQGFGQVLASAVAAYHQDIKTRNPDALDATFLSNHDQGRSAGLLFPDATDYNRRLMGATYLLLPGRPFIYYGEEIEMRGSGIDENKRLPMVWSETDATGATNPPAGANYDMKFQVKLGADDQRQNPASLLNFYRRAIGYRNKYNEYIERATLETVGTDTRVFGLKYLSDAGAMVNFTNFGAEAVTETLTGAYALAADLRTSDEPAIRTYEAGITTIVIPPYSTVLLLPE